MKLQSLSYLAKFQQKIPPTWIRKCKMMFNSMYFRLSKYNINRIFSWKIHKRWICPFASNKRKRLWSTVVEWTKYGARVNKRVLTFGQTFVFQGAGNSSSTINSFSYAVYYYNCYYDDIVTDTYLLSYYLLITLFFSTDTSV